MEILLAVPLMVCLRNHDFIAHFSSFFCLIRLSYELTRYKRNILVLLSSLLSSVATQHSSVPTPLISTQTDLPVAGSLQLYLGTQIDTPPSSRPLSRTHRNFHGHYHCQYTGIACELTVTVAAHWNYPPNPLSVHHLLSDLADHAFLTLRQAQ